MASEEKCMYIGCVNYGPTATKFCSNDCMWDENDRSRLYREEEAAIFRARKEIRHGAV